MPTTFSPAKLKKLRERKKLSRYAVAKAAGMHYANYWQLENGRKPRPAAQTISRVAEAIGVTVDSLMG